MYYCTYQNGTNPTTLYFWDNSENVAGSLGDVEIADADFYNGKYYYITGPPASDDLYEVVFNADGTILSNTKIGDIASNDHKWTFHGDIAIKDGVIYGWGKCTTHNKYEFFTYNISSKAFTVNETVFQDYSMQLAFGSNGELYGHESRGIGKFYILDQTNGALTEVIPTTPFNGLLYTDCASGMICLPEEETAWGDGARFVERGNWATWIDYPINKVKVEGINLLVDPNQCADQPFANVSFTIYLCGELADPFNLGEYHWNHMTCSKPPNHTDLDMVVDQVQEDGGYIYFSGIADIYLDGGVPHNYNGHRFCIRVKDNYPNLDEYGHVWIATTPAPAPWIIDLTTLSYSPRTVEGGDIIEY